MNFVTDMVSLAKTNGASLALWGATLSDLQGFVQKMSEGKLKALASTGLTRASSMPDLPTVDELGLKGFETSVWFGLVAPNGTSADILDSLNRDTQRALAAPELKSQFAEGVDAMGGSREQLAAYMKSEASRWGKVIVENNIKGDD